MPASRDFVTPGIDLTALACITKSDVQQAIAGLAPKNDIGFAILASTAPDVVAHPEYAAFLWVEVTPGSNPGAVYFYDGAAWTPITSNVALADHNVLLQKLSVLGGSSYDIIRVNASATAFEFLTIQAAIATGSLSVVKLQPSGTNNYALATVGGTVTWIPFSTIASLVTFPFPGADGTVPIADASQVIKARWDKIDLASTVSIKNTLPLTQGGTGGTTGQAALNNILTFAAAAKGDIVKFDGANWGKFVKGTALQHLRINAAGTDLEYVSVSPYDIPGYAIAKMSVDQAILPSTNPVIHFDTEVYDNENAFNPATYTYTVPVDGIYVILLAMEGYVAVATNNQVFELYVNAVLTDSETVVPPGGPLTSDIVLSAASIQLYAGDTIQAKHNNTDASNNYNIMASATHTYLKILHLLSL